MMRLTLALWIVFVPATLWAQNNPLLQKVTENVTAAYNAQQRPMVIFDLEGALFDNRPRIFQILQEFSKEARYVTPDAAQKLAILTLPMVQYQLKDTLAAIGINEPVVIQNAAAFWVERFYTDEYVKYDVPTPGAVDFVRKLYSSGARVVYLTARDAQRQLTGTIKSLQKFGFPIGIQATELIMKPTAQIQDAIFKQNVTNYLRQYGTVVAAVDNEPANANVFRRAFPDASVFIFQAPHSPNPPPLLAGVQPLASFQ